MRTTALALLVLGAAACSSGSGAPSPVPDFQLLDVNETSTTFDQQVSPRDYLAMTSAYYFGDAG